MSTERWCGKVSPHGPHHFIPDAHTHLGLRPSSYAPLRCEGTAAIPPGTFYEKDEPVEEIKAVVADTKSRTGRTVITIVTQGDSL
jgi:hypothetical protein